MSYHSSSIYGHVFKEDIKRLQRHHYCRCTIYSYCKLISKDSGVSDVVVLWSMPWTSAGLIWFGGLILPMLSGDMLRWLCLVEWVEIIMYIKLSK